MHIQKRLVLDNLREIYVSFNEMHSANKLGFNLFENLRSQECVLVGVDGTHSVCVIHKNVKLIQSYCEDV